MTASINPNDVDINPEGQEKDEISYLKSMDSLMNELSEKYRDLSRNKGLTDEQILNYGFNIEDIAKERHNGGFGLQATGGTVLNQRLQRFANESSYIQIDLQTGKFYLTKGGINTCRRIQNL